jgi:hypothetical protein
MSALSALLDSAGVLDTSLANELAMSISREVSPGFCLSPVEVSKGNTLSGWRIAFTSQWEMSSTGCSACSRSRISACSFG